MQPDLATMFGAQPADRFMGLPAATAGTLDRPMALIGVAAATPYPSVGAYCAGAPQAIRAASAPYTANLTHVDFDLGGPIFPTGDVDAADLGDLACDPARPEHNRSLIRDTVGAVLARGAVPLVIGGDDSVPIPMFEAYADHGRFQIIQIDAHIDWRDSVAGERLGLSSTMRRASEMAHVARLVQIGQRAIGSARPSDYQDALRHGTRFLSAFALHAKGPEAALKLIEPDLPVIISFDCDALDPSIMPGVIGPAPGGLSYWQAIAILHGIAAKAPIAGFALVEFVPERDIGGLGGLTAARLICNILGLIARQKT